MILKICLEDIFKCEYIDNNNYSYIFLSFKYVIYDVQYVITYAKFEKITTFSFSFVF